MHYRIRHSLIRVGVFIRIVASDNPGSREILYEALDAVAAIRPPNNVYVLVLRDILTSIEQHHVAFEYVWLHAVTMGVDDEKILGLDAHLSKPIALERQAFGGCDMLIKYPRSAVTSHVELRD